jgi:hypothetical protein
VPRPNPPHLTRREAQIGVRTFVDGSPGSAAAALLGMDGGPLSDETRSPHTES